MNKLTQQARIITGEVVLRGFRELARDDVLSRVDFGEFGRMEPAAVIDTVGVSPGRTRHHVGSALIDQLTANLRTLRCETIHTAVDWSQSGLLAFFRAAGFAPSQRLSFSRSVR